MEGSDGGGGQVGEEEGSGERKWRDERVATGPEMVPEARRSPGLMLHPVTRVEGRGWRV